MEIRLRTDTDILFAKITGKKANRFLSRIIDSEDLVPVKTKNPRLKAFKAQTDLKFTFGDGLSLMIFKGFSVIIEGNKD